MKNIYTQSERTEHKYTVGQAAKIAQELLAARGRSTKIYLPSGFQNLNASCTMEELNNIKDSILLETSFW